MADLNIEALATHLAWAEVNSHVMSDSWYGFPDPDDETQMRESFEIGLPRARLKAQQYADILTGQERNEAGGEL